jgi:predicted carbohydrate-binding protein with CBM5 and CBM33 domain
VVDQVQVPADLSPGKYVLSLRWDCEQTPQVWFSCADISITAQREPSTLV